MQKYGRTIQLLNDLVDDRIVPGMSWVIFDRDTQLQAVRGLAQWRPEPEVLTKCNLTSPPSLRWLEPCR